MNDTVNLEKVAESLEKTYADQKEKECEELHNAIADVLAEKKPTIQNTLYVIEMIRFELLKAKYEELMGHVIVPPGGGVKRETKPAIGETK